MTRAQGRVLAALKAICWDGWPGTVREVAEGAGLAISTAHDHLVHLELQGLAERHPRCDRGGWRPI